MERKQTYVEGGVIVRRRGGLTAISICPQTYMAPWRQKMGEGLAKAGALIALVGGAIGSVGAVVFVLLRLVNNVGVPGWLQDLEVLVGVGVAIFSVGASLALWGLASGLTPQR